MGLFSKPIIDVVQWQPQGNEVIYAYHHPERNLSTKTQLLVHESQEALVFSQGQLIGKFGPGKHQLKTENLPILRTLYGIPFGGDNPFTAEVWFINKIQTFAIDWTIASLPYFDIDYNTQLPLIASGQYGLRIIDSEKFIINFVGTKYTFTEKDMTDQSYGEICSKAKSMILQYMLTQKIGFMQISAFLNQLSNNLQQQLYPFWTNIGLELTKFYVNSIEIDKTTPEGQRIAEAISQQAMQKITGSTWQQKQMFETANNAIDGFTNMGSNGGGLLGGLMAVQMMGSMANGMGGVGNGMMQPAYNQPTMGGNGNSNASNGIIQNQPTTGRMIYCAACSKKYQLGQQFCPHCGHKYNPCPRCGSDNNNTAKRCVSCGTPLINTNNENQIGITYCTRCGAPMQPQNKFCPSCGNPR
jgi:membrane protease subunit (stomatin/prohibitin family)